MKFLQVYNGLQIKNLKKIVNKAKKHYEEAQRLSDSEIRKCYEKLKKIGVSEESLPYIIALAREGIVRALKVEPYDEQLLCTIGLYKGYICEMKTGEGKTISAAIAAIMYAIEGKVHIVTVNDYLARRDCLNNKAFFELFGLTCDYNTREKNKRELYMNDIVYSSGTELIFDYLKNDVLPSEERFCFPLDTAIVDEVDFVLLDNANSQFSVSSGFIYQPNTEIFKLAGAAASLLKGYEISKEDFLLQKPEPEDADYVYCLFNKAVYLTEKGLSTLEDFFKTNDLVNAHFKLYKAILCALEAKLFYLNGRDYIVKDNRVVLVNRNNGRLMPSSHLEADLHTAIEVKEGVRPDRKTLLSHSLSYQVFFSKYRQMTGLSGTVREAAEEFENLFNLPTLLIPEHKKSIRIDHPDRYFLTVQEKYNFLLRYLTHRNENQPVLIVAYDDSEAETVYAILNKKGINARLLTSRNTEEEDEIIKSAGLPGTVTVSTNMLGRGTDIIVSGDAEKYGGLLVIGLCRYTSRRIDNQVRGRAGRQGKPGESVFFVSMEDDIWNYAGNKVKNKVEKMIRNMAEEDIETRKKITRTLNRIQDGIQIAWSANRVKMYAFHRVAEAQREGIVLFGENLEKNIQEQTLEYIETLAECPAEIKDILPEGKNIKQFYEEQFERLGKDVAVKLLKELCRSLVHRYSMMYKHDILEFIPYLSLYRKPQEQTLVEYIRICSKQADKVKKDIMTDLLGYFLTAQLEQKTEVSL